LDPSNNVSSLYACTTGDDEDFGVFVYEAELEDEDNPCCMACSAPLDPDSTAIVTDKEHDFSDTESNLNHADADLEGWDGDSEITWNEGDGDTITTAASTAADSLNSEGGSHYEGASLGERSFDFSVDSPQSEWVVDQNEEEREQSSLSAQLLRLHHRFNHISFHKVMMMAKRGLVDKKLADAPTPVCSACLYGKATWRPWRTKPKANPKPKFFTATFPG
jgi:hypothetical protein